METVELTDTQVDKIRQAGVRRGINASITTLENLRDLQPKTSTTFWELNFAISELQRLTVTQAEEI
jgi:hypothetical protein